MTGGTFKLFVQDIYPTTDLSFASTTSEIANALSTAAYELSSYDITVECYSFGVTKELLAGGTSARLNITYQTTPTGVPMTRTTVYTDDLTGAE